MRPDDILDAIGGVDEQHIQSAGAARRKRLPRWARALATVACIVLVLAVGIDTLVRFEFLTAGCSAYPGTIIGDAYYYRVAHSGIWKYTEEDGAEFLLSTYWEDGTLINDYGLYFDRGRSLYVKAHDTGKVTRLYTASLTESSHIGLDLEPDGTVIVTIYNKHQEYYLQLRLDGITGEILETVTPITAYSADTLRYTQSTFQVGDRVVKLEPVVDSGLDWTPYTLTENGVCILPEGVYLGRWPEYVGDNLYFNADSREASTASAETVFLVRPDGSDLLLSRPAHYYCGGDENFLFYVDYDTAANTDDTDDGYHSQVGCYEIATGEYWLLPREGGEDIDVYEFASDGQVLYSSCPWDHAQALWHIVYENGRPASLKLVDEDISE